MEERDPNELSSVLDHAPCGLLQTAADGTFRRVNRTFCNWLGYDSEKLVGRRRFQDLLTVGGRLFHQTHWAPLLQMQGSLSEVKLELVHSGGEKIPMILNAVRHQVNGETAYELAAYVARDRDRYERELVLSRRRLEETVAEATRLQAEAKDRALFAEQMIGIVSHDLRNPMSTIGMATALFGHGELSPSQKRNLGRIMRATDRANRLIADLLDFTQARLGNGLSLSREPIDLHATISETVDELALVYPGRALRHERVGEGTCDADANRLAQLVGNLVSNAMTYGAVEVPVTVQSSIEPDAFSLAVHNRGTPIPAKIHESLFQPMTRGVDAPSAGRSVGLGLFIVSEIAKAHGGSAHVRSTTEGGTTFSARFPRR